MRIIGFDLSAIFRQSWEAKEGGKLGDACARTQERITKYADGYNVVVIACDGIVPDVERGLRGAPSFRTQHDPPREDPEEPGKRIGYKANRESPGSAYYEQQLRLKRNLRAAGYHVLNAPELTKSVACPDCDGSNVECLACSGSGRVSTGEPSGLYVEADDILGWLAAQYADAAGGAIVCGANPDEWSLRLVTSDMDMFQLIDDQLAIDVLSPHAGAVYRVDQAFAKYGVPPNKIAQLKALMGDASDEYHPFRGFMGENRKRGPGVGPEAAKKLLALGDGNALAAIRRCLVDPYPEGIGPHMIKVIRKHGIEAAELGLKLATLMTNLPLDFAPILAGPLPRQAITDSSGEPPPGDDGEVPEGELEDAASEGPPVVHPSSPWGQAQGPVSEALQQEQHGTVAATPLQRAVAWAIEAGKKAIDAKDREAYFSEKRALVAWMNEHGIAKEDGKAALDLLGKTIADYAQSKATPGLYGAPAKPEVSGGVGSTTADKGSEGPANGAASPPPVSANPSPPPAVTAPAGGGAADGPVKVAEVRPEPMPRTPKPSTAIATIDPRERFELAPFALEPKGQTELFWLAGRIAEARLFPKFGTADQILVVIMMGRARGISALMALENAYTVGGQVAWKSALICGCVMASGAAEYLAIESSDATQATAITRRRPSRGGIGKEQRLAYSIEDARAMGYLEPPATGKQKSSWHKQPALMLRWRALVSLARMVYYDIVSGMYDAGEIRPDGHLNDEEMGE